MPRIAATTMDCVDAEYLYAAASSVEHLCLVIQTSPVSNGLFLHHLPMSRSLSSNFMTSSHSSTFTSQIGGSLNILSTFREIITHNSSLNSIPGLGVYTAKLQSPCCHHPPILPIESQTALLLLLRWTTACRHISDQMLCSRQSV